MLRALLSSGHVADLVLVVLILEWGWVTLRAPAGKRAARGADMALLMAPGAFMLLALRAALTGQTWPWVAVWLALSFPAHLWDLRRRTASPPSGPG